MDTSGTVGRGGNHLCYRQPAVDQREQLNSPGASGRVPEFPASTDVVPVDGGISQLGISQRENVSGRLAGGSKLLAVPPKCAVRSFRRSDSKHGHEETTNKSKENAPYNRK